MAVHSLFGSAKSYHNPCVLFPDRSKSRKGCHCSCFEKISRIELSLHECCYLLHVGYQGVPTRSYLVCHSIRACGAHSWSSALRAYDLLPQANRVPRANEVSREAFSFSLVVYVPSVLRPNSSPRRVPRAKRSRSTRASRRNH